MPAKKKNNKGQEMSLGEFLGPNVATGGEHDWAEEVWDPSTEGDHGQNASAAGGAAGVDRRFHDNRYNHDRSALGTKTNFRDATSKVPDDMPPPYVAHLGNLKTGITKEELCAEFFPDKIVECRLITRDERSTFAFLEFQDVRTLQLVLLMVDRVVLGRKVRIDVASPEQIARMTNHGKNNEGGFGKRFGGSEAGGGHSSAGLDQLDRDVFGTGSPVTQGNNRNFRGNNNNNNNNNNGPMSADAFSDFRSGPTMMQHGGGGSMMDLDNWRDGGDAPQAQQPAFPGDRRRGGSRSPTASGAPSFGGGGRRAQPQQNDDNGTTAQSPTTTTEGNNEEVGGSWRDAPRQAQPELMSRREQPTTDNNSNAAPGRGPRNPNNNNKETSASSSSTQQQAPAAAAAAGDRGSFFGCSVQPNNNNNNAPTTTNTNAAAGEKRVNNKKSQQGPQSPTTAVVSAPTTTTTTTTESPAAPTAVAAATPAKPSSWAAAVTAKPAAVAPPVAPSSSSAPAKQIAARPASGTNNNQKPAAAKASSDDRFKR